MKESRRIARLIGVQNKLKAYHEMRHATLVGKAQAAEREAEEVSARKEDGSSLATVFPEIYDRSIARSLARRDEHRAAAQAEAGKVATQVARTNILERAYRAASGAEEREKEEREGLENVERTLTGR